MSGERPSRSSVLLAIAAMMVMLANAPLATAVDVDQPCLSASGWTRLSFPEPPPASPKPSYREGALSIGQSWTSPEKWYGGGIHGLYRTDDCGLSWAKLPHFGTIISPRQSFHYDAVAVSPTGRLFANRADWRLSWTDDDGQIWISTSTTMDTSPWPLYFLHSGKGWGVFYQPTRGGGGAQTLAYSTDDGLTWNHGARGAMPRIMGVDTGDGDAVLGQRGTGVIVRTTDLYATAATWATFPSSVRAVVGNDDGTRFWVATADGVLYRSRDGGQSWENAGQTPRTIRENGLTVSHHDPAAFFAINDLGELWYFRDTEAPAPAQLP